MRSMGWCMAIDSGLTSIVSEIENPFAISDDVFNCNDKDIYATATLIVPPGKKIAVYCRSGRRSAGAAAKLGDCGYKLVNLKGGIIAWKEANMPVTTK